MSNFRMDNLDMAADPAFLALRRRFWCPKPIRIPCGICEQLFDIPPGANGEYRYCSDECRLEARRLRERERRANQKRLQAGIERLRSERRAA